MDRHCKCGAQIHGYFAQHIQCGVCGLVYVCNPRDFQPVTVKACAK